MKQIPQMIADTLYPDRITRYRQTFGDESILVLFLEELESDSSFQLRRCFRHIGVDDGFEIADKDTRLNAGETKLYDTQILRYLRNHKKWAPE